ncbi:MAG: hypothetical protein AUI15_26155 [Actinobacteria bacterium 13_2_20CM_2_66_6]|nr:MAG: hypothetical protein AUI15_26155 [Actinobacteria bacterium 13_2_20CM_2_66_6]
MPLTPGGHDCQGEDRDLGDAQRPPEAEWAGDRIATRDVPRCGLRLREDIAVARHTVDAEQSQGDQTDHDRCDEPRCERLPVTRDQQSEGYQERELRLQDEQAQGEPCEPRAVGAEQPPRGGHRGRDQGAWLPDHHAEGDRKDADPQEQVRGSGQPLPWRQQVPGPQQGGDEQRGPDDERRREGHERQRSDQPRERRRRDERLRVERRPKAADRRLLSRKVVKPSVAIAEPDEGSGVSETEIVANRVLGDEQRRGDDQVPDCEHRSHQKAGRGPQSAPGPEVGDHRRKK